MKRLLLLGVALLVVLAYVMWPREPVTIIQIHSERVPPSVGVDR